MQQFTFETRADFRLWLEAHCHSEEGIWLLFGKRGGPKTLTAGEALEEALCFGWVDGQMRSLDEVQYIKYFKQRNVKSAWSEKNRALAEQLEARGLMAEPGRAKIAAAVESGGWEARRADVLTEQQLQEFLLLLNANPKAREHYLGMAPSVQRNYAKGYFFGAKTEAGREKAFARILQRLELNLNPMESLQKALNRQDG